jgi:hypothetical protein
MLAVRAVALRLALCWQVCSTLAVQAEAVQQCRGETPGAVQAQGRWSPCGVEAAGVAALGELPAGRGSEPAAVAPAVAASAFAEVVLAPPGGGSCR